MQTKITNYVEIFGRKMQRNVSFMQKIHWIVWKLEQSVNKMAMRTMLVYRAVTKYVRLKNTVVYKNLRTARTI